MICNKVLKKPEQRQVQGHLRVLEISWLRLRTSQQQDPTRLPLLLHQLQHIRFSTWDYARESDWKQLWRRFLEKRERATVTARLDWRGKITGA